PFLFLATGCGISAFLLSRDEKTRESLAMEEAAVAVDTSEIDTDDPRYVLDYTQIELLEIEIGYGLISLADERNGGDLLERISGIRRQCAKELGIIVQPIRIRDNMQLATNEYVLKIKGMEVARGEIMPKHLMVMNPANEDIELEGIPTKEPAFGLSALWIEEKLREEAEISGYTVVDSTTVMVTHLSEIIKDNSHELMGRQEVKQLIDGLKDKYSAVIEELIPDLLSLGEVQKVLQSLLRERVPIKDMVTILETLADYAGSTKNTELLTEYVRHSLSRTIVAPHVPNDKILRVITIHPDLENYIGENIQTSFQGSFPAIEPTINTGILQNISDQIEGLSPSPTSPVILASPKIRAPFKRLIELAFPHIGVLSLNEVPNHIEIEAVGMVNVDVD
ncbi:MAG TPA: FHIPEP family type III secretion protein, partial [Bacillota bacterium]|nr:FHIPEP family type III secretion protein [Bacillota bacterium]